MILGDKNIAKVVEKYFFALFMFEVPLEMYMDRATLYIEQKITFDMNR